MSDLADLLAQRRNLEAITADLDKEVLTYENKYSAETNKRKRGEISEGLMRKRRAYKSFAELKREILAELDAEIAVAQRQQGQRQPASNSNANFFEQRPKMNEEAKRQPDKDKSEQREQQNQRQAPKQSFRQSLFNMFGQRPEPKPEPKPEPRPVATTPQSILELPPGTTDCNIIKKQYRKLALQNHPDKGGDEEKFKAISNAYRTLCPTLGGAKSKTFKKHVTKRNKKTRQQGRH